MMKTVLLSLFIVAACLSSTSAEQITGTITEVGRGNFRLDQKKGLKSLYHESLRRTVRIPEDWQPAVGDKVSVNFNYSREKNIVRVVELKEAGPNTFKIESPVVATIQEIGRSRYLVTLDEYNNIERRFARWRKTKCIPKKWEPAVGDKAIIHYDTQDSKYGLGKIYRALDMEKIEEE